MGKLSNLKESHPIQIAGYVIAQDNEHEPAFNWWAHHVLEKGDRIIFLVKWHSVPYLKRIHQFEIELPNMVKEATAINKKN